MARYRASFFNNLVSSNGTPFKCLQRVVLVNEAPDLQSASEKAKREFARLENISDWKCHAHFVELEIAPETSAIRRKQKLKPRACA